MYKNNLLVNDKINIILSLFDMLIRFLLHFRETDIETLAMSADGDVNDH